MEETGKGIERDAAELVHPAFQVLTLGLLGAPLGTGPLLAASEVVSRQAAAMAAFQTQSRQLIAQLGQIYVIQTQVRVYLITLKSIPYQQEEAIRYALANRLDLMNARGQVVDAWREIEVAANALKAGLNVTVSANIANDPTSANPVDFRSTASSYSVGTQFDGPLNRVAERNIYRQSLITYEQARRSFMALGDNIEVSIRQDLRQLEQLQASFHINRQSLITAARQVEATQDRLLYPDQKAGGTTTTLDVLDALAALLNAKNALLSSYISYESTRIQLLLDMEALQLDPRGIPTHEPDRESVFNPRPDPVDNDTLPFPRLLPGKPAAP